MPQTDPMTPEELAEQILQDNVDFENESYDIRGASDQIAQRDRDILAQAADRCCVACACEDECSRANDKCERIKAILSPLNKE